MKLIDLTMPLFERAGYGEILATPNCPVYFTEYMFYPENGIRETHIKFDDESGSPFMTAWQGAPFRPAPPPASVYKWRLDEIPLNRLIMRETVILDVLGKPNRYEITRKDIDDAVAKADYRQGDDVLIRTGWGTLEKAYTMGTEYITQSPFWTTEGALRMGEIMESKRSGVMMIDTGLLISAPIQGWAWSVGPQQIIPRPTPWPSAEARERRMDQAEGKLPPVPASLGVQGGGNVMQKTIALCKCIVDAHKLKGGRTKMLFLPMLIKQGGASPCRFIAVEED